MLAHDDTLSSTLFDGEDVDQFCMDNEAGMSPRLRSPPVNKAAEMWADDWLTDSAFSAGFKTARMNPQQRIAALGTDKELSDLLDFSAVGLTFYLQI